MKNSMIFILIASFATGRSAPTPTTPHDGRDCDYGDHRGQAAPCVTSESPQTHLNEGTAKNVHGLDPTPGEIVDPGTNYKDTKGTGREISHASYSPDDASAYVSHNGRHASTSPSTPTSHQTALLDSQTGDSDHVSPRGHPHLLYGTGQEQLRTVQAAPLHGSAPSALHEFPIGYEHAAPPGEIHQGPADGRGHVNLPARAHGRAMSPDHDSMYSPARGSGHDNGQVALHIQDTVHSTLSSGLAPARLMGVGNDTTPSALTAVTTAMLTTTCTALLVALASEVFTALLKVMTIAACTGLLMALVYTA